MQICQSIFEFESDKLMRENMQRKFWNFHLQRRSDEVRTLHDQGRITVNVIIFLPYYISSLALFLDNSRQETRIPFKSRARPVGYFFARCLTVGDVTKLSSCPLIKSFYSPILIFLNFLESLIGHDQKRDSFFKLF